MTDQEAVECVVAVWDAARIGLYGGYPSAWEIHAGKVFVATIDNDRKDCQPQLLIGDLKKVRQIAKSREKLNRDDFQEDVYDVFKTYDGADYVSEAFQRELGCEDIEIVEAPHPNPNLGNILKIRKKKE
jgi:hypothetical protein